MLRKDLHSYDDQDYSVAANGLPTTGVNKSFESSFNNRGLD
jgi:hypothetical protein